jgi:hypothetical protein
MKEGQMEQWENRKRDEEQTDTKKRLSKTCSATFGFSSASVSAVKRSSE